MCGVFYIISWGEGCRMWGKNGEGLGKNSERYYRERRLTWKERFGGGGVAGIPTLQVSMSFFESDILTKN